MISKSDLLILIVASSALAVGIYRWHTNTQDVSAITIPANSRVAVVDPAVVDPAVVNPVEPVSSSQQSSDTMPGQTGDSTSLNVQSADNVNNDPVVVQTITESAPVQGIVVETTAATSAAQSVGVHQVQAGDYLGKIASQYNTDVQTLRELNGITGTIIHVGEDILYPL